MKFEEIAELLKDIPYMSVEQGYELYAFIKDNKIANALELGFAHGTSACYIAAAMDENKAGILTTIDFKKAVNKQPNITELLNKSGLEKYVKPVFSDITYNWDLMKIIEKQTTNNLCAAIYDFCYVDGSHNWTDDGFAFVLVDKLLKPGSWILFDDVEWSYSISPSMSNLEWVKAFPDDYRTTPHIRKVYDLLVRQHNSYADFRVEGNWGWAYKQKKCSFMQRVRAIF